MLEKEFIFRKSYCHFHIGDKGRVVEVIQCNCCQNPLVLCKVVDNKNTKFVWMTACSLEDLTIKEV